MLDLSKLVPGTRRGLMLVMSSPSGAGKTSISRSILGLEDDFVMSVSVTTRAKRPVEVDGRDYHFIDDAEFARLVEAGELLEYATVYGNSYGTPRQPVMDALAKGKDVMFDIDWQGAQQLRQAAGDDMVGVFILPPTTEELARRLRKRAQDTEETVRYRLKQITTDVTHWAEYDYVLINNELETSIEAMQSIITAERLRRHRQPGFANFVAQFRNPPV